jgi:D-alanyl-D-alanine carboxypeptidase
VSKFKFSLPTLKGKCISFAKSVCTALLAATLLCGATAQALAGPKPASIVIDAKSGKVMYSEDPDGLRYPASLTKMMTLYMVFEALESGRISLNSRVPVSKFAASQSPSKLGVRAGQTFTVEQGIKALVTRSANDCATALAEFLGGSEPRFGRMMTAKARSLGMTRTIYHNANGLPDSRQVTTARDQARLGVALRKHFPEYYGYFSTRSFKYGKQVIGNHNRLLGAVRGVDGIKTGFTRAAGFNLVTSAQVDGRSLVAVVMGGQSGRSRDAKMRRLVEAYLPQASRNGKSDAFVSMKAKHKVETAFANTETRGIEQDVEVASASDDLDLPNNGPVPETRYVANDQLADEAQDETVPVKRIKTVKVSKVASLDAAKPVPAEELTREMPKVDQVTTASTSTESSPKGWVIQVGAAPGKAEAQKLLQKAQDKGGKVLRSATPFTVAFSKGSEQLYRARFGGFRNQDSAVNACKALKRQGVGCWASLQ